MSSQTNTKRTGVSSVNRALDIMELLCREERLMGINEIAHALGDYPSTIHRSISTLNERGYVYQDADSLKYGLSYKLCMLGKSVSENSSLVQMSKPHAVEIANEFKETVNVSVREHLDRTNYSAITIFQACGGKRRLSVSETLGSPYDCYYSGGGKALLAFSDDYDENVMRTIHLVKHTETSIVDPEDFIQEIRKIRECGYAVDNEENENGLFCVGCPVLDSRGIAVMAISVSGYKGQLHEIGIERIVERLKKACNEISRLLI